LGFAGFLVNSEWGFVFYEMLNKNTTYSALALKKLLGPIQLEPVADEGSDFYGIMNAGIASSFDCAQDEALSEVEWALLASPSQ
jgi:hypothetical protein